jgi:hypothetical protein
MLEGAVYRQGKLAAGRAPPASFALELSQGPVRGAKADWNKKGVTGGKKSMEKNRLASRTICGTLSLRLLLLYRLWMCKAVARSNLRPFFTSEGGRNS